MSFEDDMYEAGYGDALSYYEDLEEAGERLMQEMMDNEFEED